MLGNIIRAQERRRATRDSNRVVLPFEWGAEYVSHNANGQDPREAVLAAARRAVAHSEEFYALAPVEDYRLDGDLLTWTSAVRTPYHENNTARALFFPAANTTSRGSRPFTLSETNSAPHSKGSTTRSVSRVARRRSCALMMFPSKS